MKSRRVVLGCLILLALGAAGFASAAEAPRPVPVVVPRELGFSVTHWTAEDGLPELTVTSLAQTPDGYLWCGTYSGLARFDGEHFKVFDSLNTPALSGVPVKEISCDSKGRLWIEGSSGELVVYQDGRFRRIGENDGFPPHQAGNMGGSPEGGFWVKGVSDSALYHYRNGRFETVDPGIPASAIDQFMADSRGLEWAVCEKERTMIRFKTSGPELQPLVPPDGGPERTLGRFFHLQNGALAVTSAHGIYTWRDSRWKLQICFPRAVAGQALDGVEDWEGNCWVSFRGTGLVICQPGGRMGVVALPEQAKSPFIRALMLDVEGNVWAAGDSGLYRVRHDAFRAQPGLAEIQNQAANAVVEDSQGAIWILFSKGMARLSKGRWGYLANPDPKADIATGAPSRDGGLYLACANFDTHENYLDKITAAGERSRIGKLKGMVHVILERKDGELWVGTDTGIWRWWNGSFERVPVTGLSGDYTVYAMVEDGEGRMIAGAFRRGLFRQERNGTWRRLTTTNDLGSDLVVSLYLDDESTLWAATDRGLARWKNENWHAFSNGDGTLPGWIRGVVSDKLGALWLTSQFGVKRVDRSTLNAIADAQNVEVDGSWFDRSDGLPSVTCRVGQRAVHRSADGRIWVATARGAAVVDPAAWMRRRDRVGPPPVHLETILADDKSLWTLGARAGRTEAARCLVPPEVSRLEFRYTAINLTGDHKSRFRYRLDGFDDQWVDAGNHRSAVYHSLSPGNYRFEVTAANSYGLWNSPGDFVTFTIEPHWWEMLWFQIGAGVFVVGLLWFSRSVKLRQLRRERVRRAEFSRRLIQSQEDERKRIASELHDSLGQNLLIAKNQLFLVQEMAGNGSGRIQPKLKQVSDSVDAALDEARAISHRLRPFQLERLGLTKAIRSMIRQTSDSTKLPVETRIDPIDALLPAQSEVMIYRILQEVLSNIIKHADASRASITLERRGQQVRMAVQDDGRGFDVDNMLNADDAPRGLGLSGFEERARLLGGEFHCQSSLGEGTRLTFEFPIPDSK